METNFALWRAANGQLWGRGLRHFLVAVLADARRPMRVAELAARVADEPAQLNGRPSKVISDALRWEIARDRVRKTARGVYEYATAPRSTLRFIRQRVQRLRHLLQRATLTPPSPAPPHDPAPEPLPITDG